MTELLSIVLAAGEGTRMRSSLPKVLHTIGGLPMLGHVLRATLAAGSSRLAVVIGPGQDAVRAAVDKAGMPADLFEQVERLGTAHAVLQARDAFDTADGNVLVLYGDTPFVSPQTIRAVTDRLDSGADVVVVGFEPSDPTGYGRLLTDGERLLAIREHRDASHAIRA